MEMNAVPRRIREAVLLPTAFGTVIFGSQPPNLDSETGEAISTVQEYSDNKLDSMVKRLWEIEQIGQASNRTQEEQAVEDNFLQTYKRDSEGRFVVTIPLKGNVNALGSSRAIALKRFMFLERRLQKDPMLQGKYIEFMREYESLGHMTLASELPAPGAVLYYIPHHCVLEKFRVVFDASCKMESGTSLNEVQMLGEKLQRPLFEIVMRFRRHRVAFVADIKMMFRQVGIARAQWNLQRIFWREKPNERLKEYWLTVVTYGMTSSAHCAVRAVIQCARDASKEFPDASRVIENDFYMDDCTSGGDSEQEALLLARQVDQVLRSGGFELRKWKSNSQPLASELGADCEQAVAFGDGEPSTVLGLQWLPKLDQFTFKVKWPAVEARVTKRTALSRVAQLYDPNGYIAPVIIVGRIIMQDLWRFGHGWDQELPAELMERWKVFWREIVCLEQFRIDRWLGTSREAKIQIHGFSDASGAAYGAVVYVRAVQANGKVTSKLLVSRARVAPLKTVTIPRLELSAAEMLGRLITEVRTANEWPQAKYVLWTDSMVVLHWVNNLPCNMKTFVANRVSSIQANTEVSCWRHIGTKDNPADLLSRGVLPAKLVGNQLWLHGPVWMCEDKSEWPANPIVREKPGAVLGEMHVCVMTRSESGLTVWSPGMRRVVPVMKYASKLEFALGVVANVLRFMRRLQARVKEQRRYTRGGSKRLQDKRLELPTAGPSERVAAMMHLLRNAQEEYYWKDITTLRVDRQLPENSKLASLRPLVDSSGVMRVGGRIDRARGEYEMRHPAIVPNGSRLAWLIIEHTHRATKHGSVQAMMQVIRQRFWIPRLRDQLKNFVHKCVTCARYNQRLEQQLMSELPADRVQVGKPFLSTGVDYAGPFNVKIANRDGQEIVKRKAWVVVFVCLRTRAIHIDVVTDLTSVSFHDCYKRFILRRGRCDRMYSDNGTAFMGAEKEIRKALEQWRKDNVFTRMSAKGTEWRFMVPAAPHQGGIYEAAVKSMKYHLKRIAGQRVLVYEQFVTLLTEIEGILNSRPIHPLSDDPTDVQALTPGHFLVGEPIVLPPPFSIAEQPQNKFGVRLWRDRQRMLDHFWKRWQEEYLVTLQERKKWRRERASLRIGQLVLIKHENFSPACWSLERVCELIRSKDELVRSVKVQTETGQLTRPVQKICILPVEPAEASVSASAM